MVLKNHTKGCFVLPEAMGKTYGSFDNLSKSNDTGLQPSPLWIQPALNRPSDVPSVRISRYVRSPDLTRMW